MLAAVLLLIPGYATDALGFVLFIPGLRTGIMVMLLTLVRRMAPSMNTQAFKFSMNHMNHMGQQRHDANDDETPFAQDSSRQPIHDENDASNVTIDGEYKRRD